MKSHCVQQRRQTLTTDKSVEHNGTLNSDARYVTAIDSPLEHASAIYSRSPIHIHVIIVRMIVCVGPVILIETRHVLEGIFAPIQHKALFVTVQVKLAVW